MHVSVLSENQLLFEGFLLLAVRERWPDTPARGVVMDPQGTFEHFHEIDTLLWVGPKDTAWPSIEGIEAQLRSDHIDPDTVPPAARVLASQQVAFEEQGRWSVDDVQDLVVFHRR